MNYCNCTLLVLKLNSWFIWIFNVNKLSNSSIYQRNYLTNYQTTHCRSCLHLLRMSKSGLGAIQKNTNLTLHTSILLIAVDESHTVETLSGNLTFVGKLAMQYYLFGIQSFCPPVVLYYPQLYLYGNSNSVVAVSRTVLGRVYLNL